MVRSTPYTIIVRGGLSDRFASAFPGVLIERGHGQTRMETEPLDQSQLHGLLDRLRNLAIELVSVSETSPPAGPVSQQPSSMPDVAVDPPEQASTRSAPHDRSDRC